MLILAGYLRNFGLFLFLCLLIIVPTSTTLASHEGLNCTTCHLPTGKTSKKHSSRDLRQPASALCFSCHDAELDASGLNPPYVINGRKELAGGSFTATLYADGMGHNLANMDLTLGLTPPGGQPLPEFTCLSCHDPHANGNCRNLKKKINGVQTLVQCDSDPGYQNNLYISGISTFCGACHQRFGNAGTSAARQRHPVDIYISSAPKANFNHWARLDQRVTIAQFPQGNGNARDGQVFCLTCHRAHGSAYQDAMRWDYGKSSQGCLECHTF
ncbi:MAG: hypothetical protein M0036_08980 [Desulfobacteraceae bacterium]|nr:hypothetical protein [Desulfobacteraceae bacterium]